MLNDPLAFILNAMVLILYTVIFFISLIFTFSIKTYQKIDDKLGKELIALPVMTKLDKELEWIDNWLMAHHITVGPVLAVLSIIDLRLYLFAINNY